MKKLPSYFLRIGITSVLLVVLFGKTDLKSLFHIVLSAHFGYLLSAFSLFVFLNFLIVLRWQALLKGLSIDLPLSRTLLTYLSSQFFNLVLPSTIGGDALRTLEIARHTQKHSSGVLATVVLDRVGGFFGLMTVLIFALIFGYRFLNDPSIIVTALVLLGLIFFLIGIAFSSRFFHSIFKFVPFKKAREYLYLIHEATASYRGRPGVLWMVWLLACVVQGGLPLMYYWAALSIGAQVPLMYFFIFVPVVTAISVIPVSIGGLGVRDTACVVLFAKAGMLAEKAFAVSLVNFIFIFIVGLFGGLTYVLAFSRRRV